MGRYEQQDDTWLDDIGIGLTLGRGVIEGIADTWLRWREQDGALVPSPEEISTIAATAADKAKQAARKTRQAQQKARQAEEQARQVLDQARQASERSRLLEAKLRELGIDPDAIERGKNPG